MVVQMEETLGTLEPKEDLDIMHHKEGKQVMELTEEVIQVKVVIPDMVEEVMEVMDLMVEVGTVVMEVNMEVAVMVVIIVVEVVVITGMEVVEVIMDSAVVAGVNKLTKSTCQTM